MEDEHSDRAEAAADHGSPVWHRTASTIWKRRFRWLHALAIVTGVVLVWRGIWNMLDVYLFPDQPALSSGLSILAGLILLLVDDLELRELH